MNTIRTLLFLGRNDNNSGVESNENSRCIQICSANETVLVNTGSENEFFSIVPGENVHQNLFLMINFVQN